MRRPFSIRRIQLLIAVSLANVFLPVLQAESRCPGGASSVTPRFVQGALIVIPVRINQAGPYDFIVDTGSQLTVIDPMLASKLKLKTQGTIGVRSLSRYAQASVTVLESLEANSHLVEKQFAVVQDLREIQAADASIRGVLGENFLAHFDLFIDYAHKLLCFDETKTMREKVRGERIPLVAPKDREDELPFAERLVISAHLSGARTREILLQLDSGSDGPVLYPNSSERQLKILDKATRRGTNASEAQQAFAVLPSQDLQIGSLTLRSISFVTPVSPARNLPSWQEDGLLPTLLFRRVFISGPDHYVVLDLR
jgi:aspartyl protease